jgi:hypothetical protein
MMYLHLISVAFLALPLTGWTTEFDKPPQEVISRVRTECGFDLQGAFAAATTGAFMESVGESGFRAGFSVRPSHWTPKAKIQVVFNCAAQGKRIAQDAGLAPAQNGSSPVGAEIGMSAAAIIGEEDAGGRYFRNVAFERVVLGANWKGTLAYVDGMFGDGHRTPMTFILVCDNALSRPCIQVSVEPAIQRPGKKLEPIFELVRSIAHAPF